MNKLVLIGNGFDLAHGLKTSYKGFLDWYLCKAFMEFCSKKHYSDILMEITNKYNGMFTSYRDVPVKMEEVFDWLAVNSNQSVNIKSNFLRKVIETFKTNKWVDIERYYYRLLKSYFSNNSYNNKIEIVSKLNEEFDFLIEQLTLYCQAINDSLIDTQKLNLDKSAGNFYKVFEKHGENHEIKFLNFNYTDTLSLKGYAMLDNIIHIHGRVADISNNPMIFGYGDESDPTYQSIEDSGENFYLEHIKSFGYFRTDNYHKLLSYLDSAPYSVHIVGHSCGLSDRILLNEIFEHENCKAIEIFYYIAIDGRDNFKETTHEISRHFKPHNKNIMRQRVMPKNFRNTIPQNSIA